MGGINGNKDKNFVLLLLYGNSKKMIEKVLLAIAVLCCWMMLNGYGHGDNAIRFGESNNIIANNINVWNLKLFQGIAVFF